MQGSKRSKVVENVLHFPSAMLRDMLFVAERRGGDLSSCIEQAWTLASSRIDEAPPSCGLLSGIKRPRRVSMPPQAWRDITEQALCRDRSKSWLLQRAWLLARPMMTS